MMQHSSAGCAPAAESPATETKAPTETAAANSDAVTAATAAGGEPYAGLYRATDADGTILIEDLRPDGF